MRIMKKISLDLKPDPSDNPLRRTPAYFDARTAAIAYIGTAKRTSGRVRSHLERKGVTADLLDVLISDLFQDGYLDDMTCARSILRTRSPSGLESASAARMRLIRLGVDPAVVEGLTDSEISEASPEAITTLLQKKFARFLDADGMMPADAVPGLAVRMSRFLAGRGFGYETIRKAVDALSCGREELTDES